MLGCFLFLCHQGNFSFGNAIMPSGKDFASVLRLPDEARQAVLAGCGEPDLGELVKPPHPPRGIFVGDWQDAG
jgi:hypothetical protein